MSCKQQDTLYVQTGWEPTATGDYSVRITMTTDDDATPLNNVLAKDIVYTSDVYGHDDEDMLDAELGPSEAKTLPSLIRLDMGRFTTAPTLVMAYGVAVKFGPSTGLNVSGDVEPFEFTTRLHHGWKRNHHRQRF